MLLFKLMRFDSFKYSGQFLYYFRFFHVTAFRLDFGKQLFRCMRFPENKIQINEFEIQKEERKINE